MKKFFAKIHLFFAKIFGGLKKLDQFVKDHVDDVIAIAGKILEVAKGTSVSTIVMLINERLKGKPKEIQDKLIAALTKAIDDLKISEDCIGKGTFEEKLICFVEAFKKRSPIDQNGTILKFASITVKELSPVPITENQADMIVLPRFTDLKHNISGA